LPVRDPFLNARSLFGQCSLSFLLDGWVGALHEGELYEGARLLRGGEARRSMRGMPKRSSRGMAKEEHGYGGVQGGIAGRSPRHGVKG